MKIECLSSFKGPSVFMFEPADDTWMTAAKYVESDPSQINAYVLKCAYVNAKLIVLDI